MKQVKFENNENENELTKLSSNSADYARCIHNGCKQIYKISDNSSKR